MDQEYVDGIISQTGQNAALYALGTAEHRPTILSKSMVKTLPGLGVIATMADGVNGVSKAQQIYSTPSPSIAQNYTSGLGQMINGVTFGTVPAKDASLYILPRDKNTPGFDTIVHTPSKAELDQAKFMRQQLATIKYKR